MFYVYILRSKKSNRFYTGFTSDLRNRFKQHNANNHRYTGLRGPYELIYYEACLAEDDAKQREIYFKSGVGKRFIKSRLKRFLSLTG